MAPVNVLDVLGDWSASDGPLYRRLAAAIRRAVHDGLLPAGYALPPERAMARELAVGRSTVVAAYDLLRDEAVLESRQGSGTWVAGADRQRGPDAERESLRGAAPDFAPSTAVPATIDLATAALPAAGQLRDELADLGGAALDGLLDRLGYSPLGLPELRAAVADMFTADGLPTGPHQILITTGDQQALSLLAEHLLAPGDLAVVEDPTSAGLLDLLRARLVTTRSVPAVATAGARPLRELVSKAQPALVYLMLSPSASGTTVPISSVDELRAAVTAAAGVVVEDTSSRMLTLGEPAPLLATVVEHERLITVGSMSKLFWGGLRVGWIRAAPGLIDRLGRIKSRTDLGTPLLSQYLSARLLDRLDEVRRARVAELGRTLDAAELVLADTLPEFAWTRPDGGLSLWLRLPAGTSAPFVELAHRHGVAVVPGTALSDGGGADGWIRLTYARPGEVFAEGARRLAAAWRDYGASLARAQRRSDEYPVL